MTHPLLNQPIFARVLATGECALVIGCQIRSGTQPSQHADFSHADFTGADFTGSDFSYAKLIEAKMIRGVFVGAIFEGADLTAAQAKWSYELIFANHTGWDRSKINLPMLAKRASGSPNPYIVGNTKVLYFLKIAEECATARNNLRELQSGALQGDAVQPRVPDLIAEIEVELRSRIGGGGLEVKDVALPITR